MKIIILTLTVFLISNPILAFDLFNPERGTPPSSVIRDTPQFPRSYKPKLPNRIIPIRKKFLPQKNFILLGTSRIGNKRSVILRGPYNKEFLLRFQNKRTPIQDRSSPTKKVYKGYYLLKVEARDILIEYPDDAPCRKSNEKKGIICSEDQKTATVSLKRGKAIIPLAHVRAVSSFSKPKPRTQRPRQFKKYTPQEHRRFRKKVIKPENIPEGMRVLHTPFGDRLVPIK
jgi:hypothetical protein